MNIGYIMSVRWMFIGLTVFSCMMMVIAYVMQYYMELEPCPLCILQRVALLAVILPLFVGTWLTSCRVAATICAGFALLSTMAGAGLAGRHLWLQTLPPEQVPECGPGLDYLLSTLSISEVFAQVLSGSGECAEVSWSLFSISIPGWTLIGFTLLTVGCILLLLGIQRRLLLTKH